MKALSRTWEKLFSTIAFAEEGEFETAREIMRDMDQKRDIQVVRKSMRLSAPGANRR
jgi:pentatricopeptide repeat protein